MFISGDEDGVIVFTEEGSKVVTSDRLAMVSVTSCEVTVVVNGSLVPAGSVTLSVLSSEAVVGSVVAIRLDKDNWDTLEVS